MKITSSIAAITLAAVLVPADLSAQSRVSANAFLSPTSFNFAQGVDDLRVTESYRIADPSGSTHILIEGLTPIESGSSIVTSTYSGIDISTGDVKDVGRLFFTLPATANLGGLAASPIVGIVARSGSWDAFDPQLPSTDLGGTSGTLRVNETAGTLELNLGDFSGTAEYSRVSDHAMEIADFSLSAGGTDLEFYGSHLFLHNGRLYGIIQSKNPPNDDSLMYELVLSALDDFDGDGIPDLIDANVGPWGLIQGDYKYDRSTGWIYGDGNSEHWGFAVNTYGWVWVSDFPWVWVPEQGWLYIVRDFASDGTIYLWDNDRAGWIMTNEGWGNQFYIISEGVWERFFPR